MLYFKKANYVEMHAAQHSAAHCLLHYIKPVRKPSRSLMGPEIMLL